jgi:hypothetical protein
MWTCSSALNKDHMLYAWLSLFGVGQHHRHSAPLSVKLRWPPLRKDPGYETNSLTGRRKRQLTHVPRRDDEQVRDARL